MPNISFERTASQPLTSSVGQHNKEHILRKSIRKTLARSLIVLATACLASVSHASCILPVPDGGDEVPSPANIEGNIVSIQKDIVVIQTSKTNQKVSVRLPKNEPIYTAFGGDGPSSDLRAGQIAKVWFVGCKPAAKNTVPVAAYFEIFSKDPNDRP